MNLIDKLKQYCSEEQPKQPITRDQYSNWLDHPITRQLHLSLAENYFDGLDSLSQIALGKDTRVELVVPPDGGNPRGIPVEQTPTAEYIALESARLAGFTQLAGQLIDFEPYIEGDEEDE